MLNFIKKGIILIIVSLVMVTQVNAITLWYVDGTSLKPVDSSWGIEVNNITAGTLTITGASAGNLDMGGYDITNGGTFTAENFVATSTSAHSVFINATTTQQTITDLFLSGMTAGSIPYFGSDGLVEQDNSNLFWDKGNGRLGIGTTNPSEQLEIANTGASVLSLFSSGNSADEEQTGTINFNLDFGGSNPMGRIHLAADGIGENAGHLIFSTATGGSLSEQVRIQSDGNVGIGTTTPLASLSVEGSGNEVLALASSAGTNLVTVKNDGNIGIGTTGPSQKLTIEGTMDLREQASANADTEAYGQLWTKTATPNELWFTNDAGTDTQLGTGGGDITDVFNCSTGDCNTLTVGTSEYLTYGTGYIDANRFAGVTTVDATEFGYLNGISTIYDEITDFAITAGNLVYGDASGAGALLASSTADKVLKIGATGFPEWGDDDDVPDAGDFGAGTDLDANGAVAWGNITAGELADNTVQAADIDTINCGTNCTWDATNDEIDIDDVFVLYAGDICTGVHDYGGATSFEIPNAAAPVVDTLGEIGLDTTDDQIIVMGATAKVIPTKFKIWSATIASTSPAFIDGGLLAVPVHLDGYTMTEIRCKVDGGTSKIIAVEDASANTTEDITCATTVTSDDGSITNATATAAEEMYIDFGAVSGAVNTVSISVFGTFTRE